MAFALSNIFILYQKVYSIKIRIKTIVHYIRSFFLLINQKVYSIKIRIKTSQLQSEKYCLVDQKVYSIKIRIKTFPKSRELSSS